MWKSEIGDNQFNSGMTTILIFKDLNKGKSIIPLFKSQFNWNKSESQKKTEENTSFTRQIQM